MLERALDIAVHIAGVLYAVLCRSELDDRSGAGLRISTAVQLLMLSSSALYNSFWWSKLGKLFLWMDSTAIFVMIAGTEVSFIVSIKSSPLHMLVLSSASACAVAGVMGCSYLHWPWPCWQQPIENSAEYTKWHARLFLGYVVLASFSLLLLPALLRQPSCMLLFLLGLGAYTSGLSFYMHSSWYCQRGLWHACVLTGTVLHHCAVRIFTSVQDHTKL